MSDRKRLWNTECFCGHDQSDHEGLIGSSGTGACTVADCYCGRYKTFDPEDTGELATRLPDDYRENEEW